MQTLRHQSLFVDGTIQHTAFTDEIKSKLSDIVSITYNEGVTTISDTLTAGNVVSYDLTSEHILTNTLECNELSVQNIDTVNTITSGNVITYDLTSENITAKKLMCDNITGQTITNINQKMNQIILGVYNPEDTYTIDGTYVMYDETTNIVQKIDTMQQSIVYDENVTSISNTLTAGNIISYETTSENIIANTFECNTMAVQNIDTSDTIISGNIIAYDLTSENITAKNLACDSIISQTITNINQRINQIILGVYNPEETYTIDGIYIMYNNTTNIIQKIDTTQDQINDMVQQLEMKQDQINDTNRVSGLYVMYNDNDTIIHKINTKQDQINDTNRVSGLYVMYNDNDTIIHKINTKQDQINDINRISGSFIMYDESSTMIQKIDDAIQQINTKQFQINSENRVSGAYIMYDDTTTIIDKLNNVNSGISYPSIAYDDNVTTISNTLTAGNVISYDMTSEHLTANIVECNDMTVQHIDTLDTITSGNVIAYELTSEKINASELICDSISGQTITNITNAVNSKINKYTFNHIGVTTESVLSLNTNDIFKVHTIQCNATLTLQLPPTANNGDYISFNWTDLNYEFNLSNSLPSNKLMITHLSSQIDEISAVSRFGNVSSYAYSTSNHLWWKVV